MIRRLKAAVPAVAAALAVALPTILTAAKVKTPLVLAASVAAVAAVFATFAAYWRDSLIELLKRDRSDQMALRDGCVMVDNRLPLVRHVSDPTVLGVHPARRLPPGTPAQAPAGAASQPLYVPRDIDTDLREFLAAPGFVLIAGDSTAGKSRTAFEALAAALPDHTLVAVQDKKALGSVITQLEQMRHAVLFLDDLERFLGDGGITRNTVFQLTSGRKHYLVATIRSAELGKYDSTDPGSTIVSRDILNTLALAKRIDLPRMFSESEQHRAKTREQLDDPANPRTHELCTGPEIADQLRSSGVGSEATIVLVCGLGTGATMRGVSAALERRFARVRKVGVQPPNCDLAAGVYADHPFQGIAVGQPAPFFDVADLDDVIPVTTEQAADAQNYLFATHRFDVGPSSLANFAALRSLRASSGHQDDQVYVTLLFDRGEDYAS